MTQPYVLWYSIRHSMNAPNKIYTVFSPENMDRGVFLEMLRPKTTPALALQTYEYFENDRGVRESGEVALIAGEQDNVPYLYTKLFDEDGQPISFELEKKSLEDIITLLRDPDNPVDLDEDVAEITFRSALFRYKEIEFVEAVQQLNRSDITADEKLFYAEKYRRLNEALYGSPDSTMYEKLRGEVWAAIDAKILNGDEDAQRIKSELEQGFDARGVHMRGLERGRCGIDRLTPEAAQWIKEFIFEEFSQYYQLAVRYWEQVVVPRALAEGVEPQCTGEELYEVFSQALTLRDPKGVSGITVQKKPNNSNLSWNTPTLSVNIGMAKRAVPVDSPQKLFGKIMHELLGHGGRTMDGLASKVPMTGFGIFSEFRDGGNPDYLSFEEGLLILLESIACDELDQQLASQWRSENVRYYIAIAAAELEGRNTAEIYEMTWRYSVLMDLKTGEKLTPEKIEKAKAATARANVRFKRSLPVDMPAGYEHMTYHKDMAYAFGRIKAIPLLQQLYERGDIESLRNLFKTHTDPTNPYQKVIAEKAGYGVVYEGSA